MDATRAPTTVNFSSTNLIGSSSLAAAAAAACWSARWKVSSARQLIVRLELFPSFHSFAQLKFALKSTRRCCWCWWWLKTHLLRVWNMRCLNHDDDDDYDEHDDDDDDELSSHRLVFGALKAAGSDDHTLLLVFESSSFFASRCCNCAQDNKKNTLAFWLLLNPFLFLAATKQPLIKFIALSCMRLQRQLKCGGQLEKLNVCVSSRVNARAHTQFALSQQHNNNRRFLLYNNTKGEEASIIIVRLISRSLVASTVASTAAAGKSLPKVSIIIDNWNTLVAFLLLLNCSLVHTDTRRAKKPVRALKESKSLSFFLSLCCCSLFSVLSQLET